MLKGGGQKYVTCFHGSIGFVTHRDKRRERKVPKLAKHTLWTTPQWKPWTTAIFNALLTIYHKRYLNVTLTLNNKMLSCACCVVRCRWLVFNQSIYRPSSRNAVFITAALDAWNRDTISSARAFSGATVAIMKCNIATRRSDSHFRQEVKQLESFNRMQSVRLAVNVLDVN